MKQNNSVMPNSIDIAITNYCNASCPSCRRYENFFSDKVETVENTKIHPNLRLVHMDVLEYQKFMEKNKYFFSNLKFMTFEGEFGDPMVHPKIEKFIDIACNTVKSLNISTNGGVRRPSFYEKIGKKYQNLNFTFAIDGMYHDTNSIYRRKVRTSRAIENMIAFRYSGNRKSQVNWSFLIFEHNYIDVPHVIDFAMTHNIFLTLKINNRPRFRISDDKIPLIIKQYKSFDYKNSTLVLGH